MVDMENTKLDHEQEVLRLKALIPKGPAPPPPSSKEFNFFLIFIKYLFLYRRQKIIYNTSLFQMIICVIFIFLNINNMCLNKF